ncbi:MAG: thioredoxin [Chlamydiae bacterium]|nr:thioredoxin [Chlamydiota bacterium]MBI3267199.1 thioredoxin [Chlamydiota bacterium]
MSTQINNTQDFDNAVLNSKKLVLVDFWAPWCGPCRVVGPVLEEISKELSEKVEVVKINVDESQELAVRYGIMSIPTLILLKNGKVIDQSIGASPKNKLVQWINSASDNK